MGQVDDDPRQDDKERLDETGDQLSYGPGKLIAKERRADMHDRYEKNKELDWNAWIDVRIPTWLVVNEAIGLTAKLAFGVILSFYKQGLPAKMGQETLAAMTSRQSAKTVRDALKELTDWKLIWIEPNKGSGRGIRKTNLYHVVKRPFLVRLAMMVDKGEVPKDVLKFEHLMANKDEIIARGSTLGELAEYIIDQIGKNNLFKQVNSISIEEVIFTLSKEYVLPLNRIL